MNLLNRIEVNKTSDLPRFQGNFHGNKGACMHYMLAKCSNPNGQFYHPPATDIEPWYVYAVCRTIAPVLDNIMKQGVSDIQMVGIKHRNQLQHIIWGAK